MSGRVRNRVLQVKLTEGELLAVREAAQKREMSASAFAAQAILGTVGKERFRTEAEVLDRLNHFYNLFCRTMERTLAGTKVTPELFESWMKEQHAEKRNGD